MHNWPVLHSSTDADPSPSDRDNGGTVRVLLKFPDHLNDRAPGEREARQGGCAGPPFRGALRLVLVALLVLVLADVLLRGVHGTVDLLVVLMVGVALRDPRYFVDSLAGLLRRLLGVGPRLLLQLAELAHAILLCLTGAPGLPGLDAFPAPTPTPGTDAQAPSAED